MPTLINAGIYLDFSSSPRTRAFLHQQDAVTTRETPNRLCPAHWRCPDLYWLVTSQVWICQSWKIWWMLRAGDRCFPCVHIQIFSFGNDQHKCHTANTMPLGIIRFHYASQQFRIPPRQIQILTGSDKMTARTCSWQSWVSSLPLATRRSQGSSDLLHFLICCTSNTLLSQSYLWFWCFSRAALRATFSDFGLSPIQTTKDSGRLHTSMACMVLSSMHDAEGTKLNSLV